MFLCAAMNFGNSFCGNQQSPLQSEIETYMGFDDAKFNMLFSFRCISSMLLPFVFPMLLDMIGIQTTSLLLSIAAFLGQYLFIIGL